jgi:hypothetical protein
VQNKSAARFAHTRRDWRVKLIQRPVSCMHAPKCPSSRHLQGNGAPSAFSPSMLQQPLTLSVLLFYFPLIQPGPSGCKASKLSLSNHAHRIPDEATTTLRWRLMTLGLRCPLKWQPSFEQIRGRSGYTT